MAMSLSLQPLWVQKMEKVRQRLLVSFWPDSTEITYYLEELDSYLYQTVGQDAIEFVARALEVPLYRKVIFGAAVEQGLEYGTRNEKVSGVLGDETEDLYSLLLTVKVRYFCYRHHNETPAYFFF